MGLLKVDEWLTDKNSKTLCALEKTSRTPNGTKSESMHDV